MRYLDATISGEDVRLAATFDAASEVVKAIGDLMALAREQQLAAMIPGYQPKVSLGVANIPVVLHIAAKHGGDKRTLKQWQELAFDHGIADCLPIVDAYLTLLITPHSQRKAEPVEDAAPGE